MCRMRLLVFLILSTINCENSAENYKMVLLWPWNVSTMPINLNFNVTSTCLDGHRISIDNIVSDKQDDFYFLYKTVREFYADQKVLAVTGAFTYLTKLLASDFLTGLSGQYRRPVLLELQFLPAWVYIHALSKLFNLYEMPNSTSVLFILDPKWGAAVTVQSIVESVQSHSMVIVLNEPTLTEDNIVTLHESGTRTIIALISQINLLPFAKFIKSYGLFSIEYRWFFFETNFQNLQSNAVFENISLKNVTLIETADKMENASVQDNALLSDAIDISFRYITAMLCNKPILTNNSTNDRETLVGKTGKFIFHATNIEAVAWNIFLYQGEGLNNSKKIAQLVYHVNGSHNVITQSTMISSAFNNEDILNDLRSTGLFYSVYLRSPYVFLKENISQSANVNEKLDGLCIEVVKELCHRLNVTCNAMIGSAQANRNYNSSKLHQWNESMRNLLLGKVHLIVGAFRIQQQRDMVADHLITLFNFKKSILARDPKIVKDPLTSLLQFIIPQHRYVWFAQIGAIFVASVALWIADCCMPNTNNFNLWNSIPLFAFAFVLRWPQSSPDRLSSRVMVGFFNLYCILSVLFYFCNYTAQQTSKEFAPIVLDLNDVLAKTDKKYGVINNTDALLDLQSPYVENTANLHDNILESNNFWDNDTLAISEVLHNDYVLIDDNIVNRHLSHRECNLILLAESFAGEYTFYARKGSIYVKMFNKILSEMLAEGFINKLKTKYMSNFQLQDRDKCVDVTTFGKFTNVLQLLNYTLVPQAMTLEQTFGIFCIISLGCVLALLIALVEWCVRIIQKCCRRKNKANENSNASD